ncbi:MAG: 1-deoxy-D-xylulose-5-phosphate reductoisomerase [Propionibacteriaceae bacterium]|nr:1-deoxy-D-xylulose-5-phosphate reductoisomerase [Propionibacteriaceae bacterium]
MRDVVILGSTGSIGTQAIDVVLRHKDRFRVVGLAAGGSDIDRLANHIGAVRPAKVSVPREDTADGLKDILTEQGIPLPTILWGDHAASELAGMGAHVVLNAITGYAGLEPTLATLNSGSTLALANKESLVVGGELVTSAAVPGQIVPVDSEHSAIAQALRSGADQEVSRIILTASGGPFRGFTRAQLEQVSIDDALAHPTWDMGRVVTINSSTLINKGLELMEAALLFNVDWDRIKVVVHPQSVVHSMVEFQDGSTIAQCSPPDMRIPIALGLSWPQRLDDVADPCDWSNAATWTFEPLDDEIFPAVELARRVGKIGGTLPAVFNGANEVCVDGFCDRKMAFVGIVDTVSRVVEDYMGEFPQLANDQRPPTTLDDIRQADTWARAQATELIERIS